jgi:hypothetical protein
MRSRYAEFPASPKWKCGPAVDQRQSFIVFAITFGSFLSIMPMGVMPKNLRSKNDPKLLRHLSLDRADEPCRCAKSPLCHDDESFSAAQNENDVP